MPPESQADQRALYVVSGHLLVRFRKNVQPAVKTDSLGVDSLGRPALGNDSLLHDSLRPNNDDQERRLSPTEFRERQNVDQKIDIVKEKPYQPSARPSRGHLQPARRTPRR